jgi:hypothetical protein
MLAVLLLGGCTSSVVGSASPAATSPAPTTSAPPTPSAGPTPTEEPVDVTPAPGSAAGRVLEAHRMASATVLPQLTFGDRTEPCLPSGPFPAAADLEAAAFPAGSAAEVLDRWGFVAAWAQCVQQADQGLATSAALIELSDPQSAARAAVDLADSLEGHGYEPATLEGVDGRVLLAAGGEFHEALAFVPVGRLLVYAFHQGGGGALVDLRRLLDEQISLAESFEPTAQDDVASLPQDPMGLAGFALDPPGTPNAFTGPYDLDGYLRLSIDPVRERELLTANGFRGFYTKQSDEPDLSYAVALYVFPSREQTNAVYTTFARLEEAEFGGTPFTLPAIPAAPCFSFPSGNAFYQRCYVGYRTYLASVDVLGLASAGDVARMNELLPRQRDLIDG